MGNRTDFVAGFILGGLLGTALALLFAPRTGEETRDRLTDSAEDLRDLARGRADEVMRKVRGTAEELTQRGRTKLDESASRLRGAVDRGREAFEEKAHDVRRQAEERTEG
ncbi:MAG: YtxH domain-containing protein [Armatimonadota bacterium]